MKSAFLILVLAAAAVPGNRLRVDLPGEASGGSDFEVLQYDSGTPQWVVWAGTYRGNWFNTQDFDPASIGFALWMVEYWLYEHPSYPWDTSQFYSEVWSGDDLGPTVLLAQDIVTAEHYAPVYHNLDPCLETEQWFWCLQNTEMSGGGWPSILADGAERGLRSHAFFRDDNSLREAWSSPSPGPYGYYFIRAHGEFLSNLNATTWGSVKSLF